MKKNILITGTSKGIGSAIKNELSNSNFNCICPTREELDINNSDSIENYFNKLNIEIHGLVNNAGINVLGNIESLNDEDIQNMLNINLIAPLKLIQHVVKNMRLSNYGKIVNISSIWGVRSKEFRTLYSMTKFGINGMTKSLARELGEYNILINSIAPGYVNTEMTKKNVPFEEQIKIKENIPLKRFAEPEEIAKLGSFLISEKGTG